MTAREMIYRSLRIIGVNNPSSIQLDEGLKSFNNMITHWATDNLKTYAVITETFSLVVGQSIYTIGVGGDINTVRPLKIYEGTYIVDSDNTSYPVIPMTRMQYNQIASKISEGRPTRMYYEPESPLGKIRFNYESDNTETVYLDSLKIFTEVSALNSSVVFPPEYERALKYNLAVELISEYPEVKLSDTVAILAQQSLSDLRINNSEPTEEVDSPATFNYQLSR